MAKEFPLIGGDGCNVRAPVDARDKEKGCQEGSKAVGGVHGMHRLERKSEGKQFAEESGIAHR